MALKNETPIFSRVKNVVTAMWIIGTTILFLVSFSMAFYEANRSAIDSFITSN